MRVLEVAQLVCTYIKGCGIVYDAQKAPRKDVKHIELHLIALIFTPALDLLPVVMHYFLLVAVLAAPSVLTFP